MMMLRYYGQPNAQHTAVDSCGQGVVLHDRHALVGPIGRVLEEHDGGPVVGKVLGKRAGRAGALVSDVARHSGVEGIASYNLM